MASDEKSSGPAGKTGAAAKGKASGQTESVARVPQAVMLGVLMLAVLVVGAVGGLVMAKFSGPQTVSAATPPDTNGESGKPGLPGEPRTVVDDKYAYIELEPVIVNLDEHRLMRYVRATVVLELDATNKRQLQQVQDLIERRRLVLKNRLTLFLAGKTPDEVRGDKALRHLERRILDDFNQELWPNKKGLIRDAMFKEFAVQ